MPSRPVGTGEDEILLHERPDILFVHVERRHGRASTENDGQCGHDRFGTLSAGDRFQRLAANFGRAAGDQEGGRPITPPQVLAHVGEQALACLWVAGAVAERVASSRLGPPRQE